MDGFAVRAADTASASGEAPVTLDVVDESRAGRPAERPVEPGEAILISTGAMVPEGADSVVRVEDASSRDGRVEIEVAVETGRNVRRAGEDMRSGETVIRPGTVLGPAELGVIASVGREAVEFTRRPSVCVITTGDELHEPGEPLSPGGVRNSNAHSVPALVDRAGGEVVRVETVPDEPAATPDVQPGDSAELAVDLDPGAYALVSGSPGARHDRDDQGQVTALHPALPAAPPLAYPPIRLIVRGGGRKPGSLT